ncbi:unnamed protein product [Dimorphilus gyrociliatus]|uniref:RING-type domain-containing protein n=1 Tax=Dimorphilus gyrociliatus TaxID=2664684 RepID=A0A7I8V6M0_9ANNE|nr:unnamed protein product [Dimorphilus gyrociliatus]
MASASTDVDFNKIVKQDQTLCAICHFSWVQKDARCLPCKDKVHIFCSDCLRQLAHNDESHAEGILFCPVCKMAHRWTEEGVASFPRLDLFNSNNDDDDDGNRLRMRSRTFVDAPPNHTRSYVEEIIVSVLRNLHNQEIQMIQKINETAANHMKKVREQRHKLLEEVLMFYDEKESELIDIIREFAAFEKFSKKVGETNKKVTKMKIRLNNKANSCFHRNIEFIKDSSLADFSIGLNKKEEEFKVSKELCRLPTGGRVCNTSFFNDTLYLLTEKFGGSLFFYKLLRYQMKTGIIESLHEWNNSIKIEYKLAVSVNIYLLTVGEIRVQRVTETEDDDGKFSCTFSTFYDIMRRKNDTTSFVHIIGYEKGIVLCCQDLDNIFTFKKIKDPVKQKWKISLNLPLLKIVDMRINSSQLFALFTENLHYIFDLNSGKILNKLKTSTGSPREVLGITKYRFCTKILFQSGCCLIGNDFVRLIDKTEDGVSSWSYKKIFDLYHTIEYGKCSEGIIAFLILDKWINTVYLKYIKC